MDNSLFIRKISNLKVDRSKGAPAPHKPVLLLSLIQSIEYGEVQDNRFFITAELVARFRDNWHLFVTNEKFSPNFSLPFYHLKSDGFWHLRTEPGKEILLTSSNSIKSFASLKNTVAYAYFDADVYRMLLDNASRQIIKQILFSKYLGVSQMPHQSYDLFHEIESQILNDSTAEYKYEIAKADEEEIFVRSGVFKKVIPKVYNYTCCISGMKITANRDIQMIDACHIVPFAESHDDTITNGLSLSPNFHRAFDRFLITINEDFEIIVSEEFIESGTHPIRAFHGKKILLPNDERCKPAKVNLRWHYNRFDSLYS